MRTEILFSELPQTLPSGDVDDLIFCDTDYAVSQR
jgi:hypothetical protein